MKKRQVKQALAEGKPLPTEIRAEEQRLRKEVELEDDNTAVARTHVDDEYNKAGWRDPKTSTTSRPFSAEGLCEELKLVFPNSQRMNGNQVVPQMVEPRGHDFTDIVIVQEHRGEPDGMIVCHLPFGPTAYFGMYNTVLRHDIQDAEDIGECEGAARRDQYPFLKPHPPC